MGCPLQIQLPAGGQAHLVCAIPGGEILVSVLLLQWLEELEVKIQGN